MTTAQKLRGTILGLAWGDVLGYPVETWEKQEITELYNQHNMLPSEYPSDILAKEKSTFSKPYKIGLHSDDTQQAIVLIHSSLNPNGWSVDRWAQYLLVGQLEGAWRGTGKNFRQAVDKISNGLPPLECGEPSAGTGGAMRIAPIGALYRNDVNQIEHIVYESTRTTHSDIRGISITYAVALCCAMLINDSPINRIRGDLSSLTQRFESKIANSGNLDIYDANHVHAVSSNLSIALKTNWGKIDDLREWLIDQSKIFFGWNKTDTEVSDPSKKFFGWNYGNAEICNHPFAQLGGIHGICMGLWPDSSPHDLLIDTVRQGGDTDTIGAIAGAILGARFGDNWINVDRFKDKMIAIYADALVTGTLPESFADFVSREAEFNKHK